MRHGKFGVERMSFKINFDRELTDFQNGYFGFSNFDLF